MAVTIAEMEDQIQLLHESLLAGYAETLTTAATRVKIFIGLRSHFFGNSGEKQLFSFKKICTAFEAIRRIF